MVEHNVPIIVPKSGDQKNWRIVYYTVFPEGNEILIARTYGLRSIRPHITEEVQTIGLEKVLSKIIITGVAYLLIEKYEHILNNHFLVFREKKFIVSRKKIPQSVFSPEEHILAISPFKNN